MLTCSALTISLMSVYAGSHNKSGSISAEKTIAELQEERKQNEAKIAELESEINSLENNKNQEKAYQNTLSEQITLIQNNIKRLDDELTQINADIAAAEGNIENLNNSIDEQQAQVDSNIELFKERLCAMYVTGNNSLASAVLGSTDFYDMLSRVEMVNCIAEHDEELVNKILDEIDTLEKSKSDLETEKLTLEMKQDEQIAKKEEKQAEIDNLNEKYQKSEEEIARLALEEESRKKSKEEIEAQNKKLQEQEDAIVAQIKAAEEAAKKAEQERLAKEEADRLAAQQAAQQQNSSGNNSNNNVSDTGNTTDIIQTPTVEGGFAWPAPGFYYISSGYGARWGTTHRGIDIAGGGIAGAAATASKGGTVIGVVNSCGHNYPKGGYCCGDGYGNYVIVSHGDGTSTLYGHLQSVAVSVGDYVSQGQTVGYIGCTGFSTGFHLHFEIRVNGVAVDPQQYV